MATAMHTCLNALEEKNCIHIQKGTSELIKGKGGVLRTNLYEETRRLRKNKAKACHHCVYEIAALV